MQWKFQKIDGWLTEHWLLLSVAVLLLSSLLWVTIKQLAIQERARTVSHHQTSVLELRQSNNKWLYSLNRLPNADAIGLTQLVTYSDKSQTLKVTTLPTYVGETSMTTGVKSSLTKASDGADRSKQRSNF